MIPYARAEQDTASGPVARGWSITHDRLTVTVPPASSAVLEIPTADPGSVRDESGSGTLRAEPSATGATPRLPSGRFTFTATHAL